MPEEITAQPGSGEALPANNEAATQQPAPKSDAEAAQREAATAEVPQDEAKAAADKAAAEKAEADKQQATEKQRNRTRDYINRINSENAEYRRRLAELEARERPQHQAQQPRQGPPAIEDYDYDLTAWQEASSAWNRQQWAQEQQQAQQLYSQQETQAAYDQRVTAFADQHPDFFEAVGSIDPNLLTAELQAAVIGHERGPEIAYHLANNDDALWNLASVRADLLPAAIARLASRLDAAQPAPPAPAPAPAQPVVQPKPISQAPAPAPTVGGRSPTEIPQEKLTDEEWYRRDVERRRKR